MTQPLLDEVKRLAQANPVYSGERLERRMSALERMLHFYSDKAPAAPGNQSPMFYGFADALGYSLDVVRKYRSLTKKLAKLADEEQE